MKKMILLLISMVAIHAAVCGQTSKALSQLVYEIRNPETDAFSFRQGLERIGEYLAMVVLEELQTKEVSIQTLTGANATHLVVEESPVLVTILRAGLPLNEGVQKIFPKSEVGFFAMSRDEKTFKAKIEYVSLPSLKDRYVIVSDTMLATGGSLLDVIQLIEKYEPKMVFVITAIASQYGIERILQYNSNVKIFAAVIDPDLNEKGYIVPGLGDAGDRSYGKKTYTTADLKLDMD